MATDDMNKSSYTPNDYEVESIRLRFPSINEFTTYRKFRIITMLDNSELTRQKYIKLSYSTQIYHS